MFCKIVVHLYFPLSMIKKHRLENEKIPGQGKGMGYLFFVPIAILIEMVFLSTHNIFG